MFGSGRKSPGSEPIGGGARRSSFLTRLTPDDRHLHLVARALAPRSLSVHRLQPSLSPRGGAVRVR